MNIGIIGDTHFPAVHPEYLSFLKQTFEKAGVTQVVHIGDVIDHHRISRHVSEPDSMTADQEVHEARELVKQYAQAFPEMRICRGNHDAIPIRQAKELGMPADFIQPLEQLYKFPSTWEIQDNYQFQGCWYEHGIGSTGMYGMINTALKYGCNYIQGHTHSFAGCLYRSSPVRTLFGLNVGCGVDIKHTSMRYGDPYKFKPTLGCGLVIDGKQGYFVRMGI